MTTTSVPPAPSTVCRAAVAKATAIITRVKSAHSTRNLEVGIAPSTGPASVSVRSAPIDGRDSKRCETPASGRPSAERHRDRRREVAADDEGHHDEERHRPAGIARWQRMSLDNRDLLIQRGRGRREGGAKSGSAGGACRRNHDQLRSRRAGDERAVDLPLIDRVQRIRLARVLRRFQRELLSDGDGQRGSPDDAEGDLVRLRMVEGSDVGEHEQCLHEEHDTDRHDQQRNAAQRAPLRFGAGRVRALSADAVVRDGLTHADFFKILAPRLSRASVNRTRRIRRARWGIIVQRPVPRRNHMHCVISATLTPPP